MTHRIKSVKALDNFIISVVFFDGVEKEYDLKNLFSVIPQFQIFEKEPRLFEKVQVDAGGYGISWNDKLDLDAEEIWHNGKATGAKHKLDILEEVGANLTQARECVNITQKELSERVKIYQGDISKIERGSANPSIKTLQRLAEGMGMRVKVEFVFNQEQGSDINH